MLCSLIEVPTCARLSRPFHLCIFDGVLATWYSRAFWVMLGTSPCEDCPKILDAHPHRSALSAEPALLKLALMIIVVMIQDATGEFFVDGRGVVSW